MHQSRTATYALEHLGGQSHAFTSGEFRTRYEEHVGPVPICLDVRRSSEWRGDSLVVARAGAFQSQPRLGRQWTAPQHRMPTPRSSSSETPPQQRST